MERFFRDFPAPLGFASGYDLWCGNEKAFYFYFKKYLSVLPAQQDTEWTYCKNLRMPHYQDY